MMTLLSFAPVFAHAGHWLANLAYAAPVIGLLGWMAVLKVREARERRKGRKDGAADEPGDQA